MLEAKAISGIVVNSHYCLDNEFWLETDCKDYEAWSSLPAIVAFGGQKYGKTGWNSDLHKACYSTGKSFATY